MTTTAPTRNRLPSPLPSGASVEEQRARRRERVAVGCRVLHRYGLVTGPAGHITARDPEHADQFWVNPAGRSFGRLRASDVICVTHDGEIVEGEGALNPAAFVIHSRIHARFPELHAACHSHAPAARPFSATGRLVEPTSQDACTFYEAQVLVNRYTGSVLELDEGRRIAEALAAPTPASEGNTVAILGHHGHLTVGGTVDEAVYRFVLFEQCVDSQLRLESTGRPYHVIDHETAAKTRGQVASAYVAQIGFAMLYEQLVHEEPDVLG